VTGKEVEAIVLELHKKVGARASFKQGERVSVTIDGFTAYGQIGDLQSAWAKEKQVTVYPVILDGTGEKIEVPYRYLGRVA
jgi:hypothetical protein